MDRQSRRDKFFCEGELSMCNIVVYYGYQIKYSRECYTVSVSTIQKQTPKKKQHEFVSMSSLGSWSKENMKE